MTAPIDWNEDVPIVGVLAVACGLSLCGAQPGEPCVNTENREVRDEPHSNRVARSHRPDADPSVTDWRSTGLSTSAQLQDARAQAERYREELILRQEGDGPFLVALRSELAKAQGTLAASQSDLTTALAERDRALDDRDGWKQVAEQLREDGEATARAADKTREALAEEKRLRARPLPVTDDEIRAWYRDRGLTMSCGPALLFSVLRREFGGGS